MIPLIKLPLNEDDVEAVVECVRSGNIGLGDKIYEFEKELAKYTGCKYAVTTDSCTSALFLSVKYLGFDRIGIPSMTVPLVVNAILEAGATPYLTDDIEWVGTHYNLLGTPIYDSAHELYRNCYKDYPKDAIVCLSFYPTKPIGSADGGAILTNDKEFADWVRCVSCYGRNQTQKYQNSWEYDITELGYKRHYTALQSSLCASQLRRLDNTNLNRTAVRDAYNSEFGLKNKSLYLYRVNVQERDKFISKMLENEVICGVHYRPIHDFPIFSKLEFVGDIEKVNENYKTTVSIPFYADMNLRQVEKVIELTKGVVIK